MTVEKINIEDIFIDPKIIEESKLTDGQTVKGRAILSFNKKKNEWGWKAIIINILNQLNFNQ